MAQLQAINARTAQLKADLIDQNERRRVAQEALAMDETTLTIRRDQLQAEQDMADTADQRRKLALQIIDIEFQLKEKELRAVLAPNSGATASERDIAQAKFEALPGQKAAAVANANSQNQSPGAAYLDTLGFDKNQFVSSEEVKALSEFNAGLDDSVKKALHLHGIFGNILSDLIDMAIKQALIKPLATALFGGDDGSSGGGGLFGSLLGSLGGIFGGGSAGSVPMLDPSSIAAPLSFNFPDFALPGFANGGTIGGFPGVDQNVLSINGSPVARVGQGELLTITPNVAAANQRASSGSPTTIIAPQHFDLSNAVMTPDLVRQINTKNQQYTDTLVRGGYAEAVKTAGSQAPRIVQRNQTLNG